MWTDTQNKLKITKIPFPLFLPSLTDKIIIPPGWCSTSPTYNVILKSSQLYCDRVLTRGAQGLKGLKGKGGLTIISTSLSEIKWLCCNAKFAKFTQHFAISFFGPLHRWQKLKVSVSWIRSKNSEEQTCQTNLSRIIWAAITTLNSLNSDRNIFKSRKKQSQF